MANSHYEIDILFAEKFIPLSAKDGDICKFGTRQKAEDEAIYQVNHVGRPAKVVLVKTIRSVIVAYKPRAVKP